MAASAQRPSAGQTDASNISVDELVADEVYSLIDAVDSESIAEEFDIGIHTDTHDFENHLKVAVREGLDYRNRHRLCTASAPLSHPYRPVLQDSIGSQDCPASNSYPAAAGL
jgi:hypothetical protein